MHALSRAPLALASMCFATALIAAGCVEEEGADMGADGILGDGGTGDMDQGDQGDGDQGDGDAGDQGGDAGDQGDEGDSGDGDSGDGDTDTGEQGCDVPSPYMGGWDVGCCQDGIVSTGWSPGNVGQGSVMPDWTFTDQFGESVRVYDFCHEAIYFEYSAMWCGACQAHAPEVASLYNTYSDQGLMTLTFMSESASGGPASLSDVQTWSSNFGQQGLVVFGTQMDVWYPFGVDQGGGSFSIALPGTMLVGRNAKVAKIGVPTIQEIEIVIPGN